MRRSGRSPARLPVPSVSQVVQRIVGNSSGLSHLSRPNVGASGVSAWSAPSTSTDGELRSSFPSLYGPRGARPRPYSRPPKPRYSYTPRPPKNFLKQVVVVGPGVCTVPRGQAWQDLHDMGCIADVMEIGGTWTEEQLFNVLESAFSRVLDQSMPPPRFEIMKANGNALVVPNVVQGQTWSADKVKAICKTTHLYIRALKPLVGTELEDESHVPPPPSTEDLDDLDDFVISPPEALSTNLCVSSNFCAQQSTAEQSELAKLQEMFPHHEESKLRDRLLSRGFELAVLSFLDDDAAVSSVPVKNLHLDTLLMMHAAEMIDSNRDTYLTVSRAGLWQRAICFYKASKNCPQKLKQNLVVTLENEDGMDAGAIRGFFFEHLMKEVNERLFEGDSFRRVPKKDSELCSYFELAGLMVAHSVLQGGPSVDCICPAVYTTIMSGALEEAVEELSVHDIPLNAGTADLIAFIHEIDQATDDEVIDKILQEPAKMAIVNASRWPVTKAINMCSKSQLIQEIMVEEVLSKRGENIRAFQKGLSIMEFLDLCQKHPTLTKELFVYVSRPLTASMFLQPPVMSKLISKPDHSDVERVNAFNWFIKYINERFNRGSPVTLEMLLRFITGQERVPPMGLQKHITIHYLPLDDKYRYPTADCCFSSINLPVIHQDKDSFFAAMDEAVLESGTFFYRE